MSNTNSSNNNSKSYIRIVCNPDSNPEINVIELRDEKHTRIGLHPGENIITVEEYPELKYGFLTSQIGENGFLTHYIDLDMSNFDGSNMVTMEDMFARATFDMDEIKPIDFGNLDTSNVIDMSRMFEDSTMDWFEFKPLFNTSSVTKMDGMFDCYTNYKTVLDLSGFDVSNVKSMKRMFSSWGKKIILDGWKINNKEVVRHLFDVDCCNGIPDITVSLKKCDSNTIKWIAEEVRDLILNEYEELLLEDGTLLSEDGTLDFNYYLKKYFILDPDIKIKWNSEDNSISLNR